MGRTGWALCRGVVRHPRHVHSSFSWDWRDEAGPTGGSGRRPGRLNWAPAGWDAGEFAPLHTVFAPALGASVWVAVRSVYRVAILGQKCAQITLAPRRLWVCPDGLLGGTTFWSLPLQARGGVPVTRLSDTATWRAMSGRLGARARPGHPARLPVPTRGPMTGRG